MSKEIKKGFALVDSLSNLHWLDEEMSEETAAQQRDALVADLGLVVSAFEVEANGDAWAEALALVRSDRKVEAWQKIITEGRVL